MIFLNLPSLGYLWSSAFTTLLVNYFRVCRHTDTLVYCFIFCMVILLKRLITAGPGAYLSQLHMISALTEGNLSFMKFVARRRVPYTGRLILMHFSKSKRIVL